MKTSERDLEKARSICMLDFFDKSGKRTWTFNNEDLDALANNIADALAAERASKPAGVD